MNYYNNNAQAFADATLSVNMGALYEPFIKHLPPQARVLDAGCGAGRDAKAFAQMGFKVEAFDASEAMVGIAQQQGDFVVEHNTFLGFTRDYTFDGIWACASLLHVPAQELPATFRHLASLLADNGVFYVSFKYGEGETQREGRHFTHCNEGLLPEFLHHTGLGIMNIWVTADKRPERAEEQWLNALLEKRHA